MPPSLAEIVVHRKPTSAHGAILVAAHTVHHGVLGRGGTGVFKREGDGATPAEAIMRPRWLYFRPDRLRRPRTPLAVRAITPRQGWCDAPGHASYNGPVRLPFAESHEAMWRDDGLYDVCVVLDWNMAPCRARHRGSAIFLHAANRGLPPTAGCIAVPIDQLIHLVARLSTATRIRVVR